VRPFPTAPWPARDISRRSGPRTLAACGLVALLVLVPEPAKAQCDCLWRGSFATVHKNADLVVAAQVVSAQGNSIDIDITRRLRGPDYIELPRVWLQARDYCRPPPEDFPPGSTWVMALERIDAVPEGGFDPNTPDISYGREGDYYLSSCGGYWLRLSDDVVTGPLIDSARWAREPKMTPVLLDLVDAHVQGRVGDEALREASRENPDVRELMLDTKEFLRSLRGRPPQEDRQ
jgi:hypothetical protein